VFFNKILWNFSEISEELMCQSTAEPLLMKNYIIKENKFMVLKAPNSLGVPHRSHQKGHTIDREEYFLGFRILTENVF